MPKKLFGPLEPPVILQELFKEFLVKDKEFVLRTTDPAPELFADKLIAEHYPPQTQLPLD